MLIVGEKINTSRADVREAVARRDAGYIQDLAAKQVLAGAHLVDVNAGTFVGEEVEALTWLVRTVQQAVEAPLCIDTPNPEAMEAALAVHRGRALVNSITAEKDRFERVLPLVKKHGCMVVALCMDDTGIPATAEERVAIAEKLYALLCGAGLTPEDIFLDPLVQPISSGDTFGAAVIDCIRQVSVKTPGVRTICGLSNVSYGMPKRKLLNGTFMVLAIGAGLDAVIVDPLDSDLMSRIYAAQALLGKDRYCREYLQAYRKGKLEM
ncbi:methyltetrahydrofolate:corrinoid methyltransferase [Clostridiales bacterium PH28_bin88]|nr:methyltetrahydrofolate:corrinoid methyltransferase [Clostridiales bacterium PH28_bin88]